MKKLMMAMSVAVAIAGMVSTAQTDEREWPWSPLGLGIAAPVQVPLVNSDIYGVRLGGLLGINYDVFGIDAGLVEITEGSMFGVQASGFTWTRGKVYGIQAGFFANVAYEDVIALQAGFANIGFGEVSGGWEFGVVNYDINYYGLQVGALNWNNSSAYGLQFGVGNATQEDFSGAAFGGMNFVRRAQGMQLGFFNMCDDLTGFQFGLINVAERVHGVQIGGINMIVESKLPVMVVLNAMF